MSLIALVYNSRGSLEAIPDIISLLFGNGTELLPLLVKLLELVESVDHILVLGQLFGRLAELFFSLEILLEVKVAEVAADLDHIVELLYVKLIGIVDVPVCVDGHRAGLSPAVLQLAESRERCACIFFLLDQGFEFIYDCLLGE